MEPAPHRLHAPLPTLAAWVAHFVRAPIPVLGSTAALIGEWQDHEDAVDAHSIAEEIASDPLMTLRLLSHVGGMGRETDVETVVAALVLMGVGPFFRHCNALCTLEGALGDFPPALAGARTVLTRAHRASRFALAFAAHRLDPDAAVLHEAALLHDFAELLLWCHAPRLALQIARRQETESDLRSADAQRAVLGIELGALQQALMRAWRLPALLIRLDDDRHADNAQVKNVLLAVRIARHSQHGWDNPALPDDVTALAGLLQLGLEPTRKLLLEIDA